MIAHTDSPFAVRGVIEGFYGNPWTHDQRLRVVEFIAARGMNTFVYAPKDDSRVRRDWRVAYDGPDLERMTELADRCRLSGVDLVYCLSPGLSIRYGDPADVDALVAKLAAVGELGVDVFGLLLDDIPAELQHPADRERFDGLAEAHVHLVSAMFDRLPPGARMIVCPTVYWGRGDEEYLARLGRGIDPRIDLFWSGRAICSATLDLPDAATFVRTTGRPAVFWDNYPVNDVAMTHELHIGPYRGRDPDLARFARGVIANGMELFESSTIAFATIADYLTSPHTYQPDASWHQALVDVVGSADVDAFATFADNVRSSCLCADDAPVVTRALEQFAFRVDQGQGAAAAADLAALADRLLAAADHLLSGRAANVALVDETRPWIAAFQVGARALHHIAELAADGRLESDAAELGPYLDRLRRARVRVFGDALDMVLSDLTGTHVRPGVFPALDQGGSS